jgi:uncharacterized protein (TIGR02757 family)
MRPSSCVKRTSRPERDLPAASLGSDIRFRTILERLYAARGPQHLANDPLSFCHRYSNPADQETAAVIAAAFSYGGIKIILRSLESIFGRLGPSPGSYVDSLDPGTALRTFSGFRHRFNDARDLVALLWAIRLMREDAGSVNAFFLRFHVAAEKDVARALNGYSSAVLALDYRKVFGGRAAPADSCFPFLFPSPAAGSACKRLCMFLRWVVRPADGIDLGIWSGVSPSQLVIPVDTHISRICSYLGFTGRSRADWRMACEITAALRRFAPEDPVRYDFSLAHLGISEKCTGADRVSCLSCTIREVCPQAERLTA